MSTEREKAYGVPQPVGSSGESNTTGADRQREDLANDNPSTRAPGGGEEEDEDGNEGDLGIDSRDVVGNGVSDGIGVGLVEADGDTDDGNEELADEHTKGTPHEERATADLLNSVEGDGGGADVDEGEDEGDQEDVGDGTGGLQEDGRVVEDEVNTSPVEFG